MFTLEEFLQNKTWNPSIMSGPDGKKILHMRLQMKPGTTANQLRITLNGHDLRVGVENKASDRTGQTMSMHISLSDECQILFYIFFIRR